VLLDAQALKKLAVDYLHPEQPVVTTDDIACGRNYFTRPSASELDDDDAEERGYVLADAQALKKFAEDYLHPEKPVFTTDAFASGRNYFTRPSAPELEDEDEAEERAQVLTDAQSLKKIAEDYYYPEMPVETSDVTACARNYFDRPSAPLHEHYIHSQGITLATVDEPHVVQDHYAQNVIHYHCYNHFGMHDDNSHSSYDHFDMDEDIFTSFRESVVTTIDVFKGEHPMEVDEDIIEKEGNLSRSPSSVMLFNDMEAIDFKRFRSSRYSYSR
jgi:hypothetical protein